MPSGSRTALLVQLDDVMDQSTTRPDARPRKRARKGERKAHAIAAASDQMPRTAMEHFVADATAQPTMSWKQAKAAVAVRDAAIARGDHDAARAAVEQLVRGNMRYCLRVVHQKYMSLAKSRRVEPEDLVAEAMGGLLRAAEKYNGLFAFTTYAEKWIRQRTLDFLNRHSRVLAIPSASATRVRRLERASQCFEEQHGRLGTPEEIAKVAAVPYDKAKDLIPVIAPALSLSDPTGGDASRGDRNPEESLIVDVNLHVEGDRVSNLDQNEMKRILELAMRTIPREQQVILSYRFGLNGWPELPMSVLKDRLHMERETVRSRMKEALNTIKDGPYGHALYALFSQHTVMEKVAVNEDGDTAHEDEGTDEEEMTDDMMSAGNDFYGSPFA